MKDKRIIKNTYTKQVEIKEITNKMAMLMEKENVEFPVIIEVIDKSLIDISYSKTSPDGKLVFDVLKKYEGIIYKITSTHIFFRFNSGDQKAIGKYSLASLSLTKESDKKYIE